MALLGRAALAMWWDMAPALRAEFEQWHTQEHFPERLAIPGFLRASRWSSSEGGEGFFVLYDLADYETFTAPAYRERLNNPTPWSLKMMPAHRNMVRSQCRVLASVGSTLARHLATWRFSPQPGADAAVPDALRPLLEAVVRQPGIAGAHLLRTDTPAAAQTAEQRLRGGQDAAADWVLLVAGYALDALRTEVTGRLGAAALTAAGAQPDPTLSLFQLCHAATPADF